MTLKFSLLLLITGLTFSQNLNKSYDAALGIGIGSHTTEISNFDDSYDTDSWFIYDIDLSLKLYEIGEEFVLYGQLSFTGGPAEYSGTVGGTGFTREFSQSFIDYGIRVAYLTFDYSMSWIGFGISDTYAVAKSKVDGSKENTTTYDTEAGNYFEIGSSLAVDDEYAIYFIWRGVDGTLFKDSNSFGSTSIPKFAAGGQHFLIGLQWMGNFNF